MNIREMDRDGRTGRRTDTRTNRQTHRRRGTHMKGPLKSKNKIKQSASCKTRQRQIGLNEAMERPRGKGENDRERQKLLTADQLGYKQRGTTHASGERHPKITDIFFIFFCFLLAFECVLCPWVIKNNSCIPAMFLCYFFFQSFFFFVQEGRWQEVMGKAWGTREKNGVVLLSSLQQ